MFIVDFDGPSAVGKSSLIHELNRTFPSAESVQELLMQKKNPYSNWQSPSEFLAKQLWFFEQTVRRYESRSNVYAYRFNDIGILDVMIHSCVYPLAHANDWDVSHEFLRHVRDQYGNLPLANQIYYLSASVETVKQRMEKDTSRVRGAFRSNLKLLPYQHQCYEKLAIEIPGQVIVLDAEVDAETLLQSVVKQIHTAKHQPAIRLSDLVALLSAISFKM